LNEKFIYSRQYICFILVDFQEKKYRKLGVKIIIHVITGGAVFIGSNLVGRLLNDSQNYVLVIDNFSRGKEIYLSRYGHGSRLDIIHCNISDYSDLIRAISNVDLKNKTVRVWHLAANSDIPAGVSDVTVDLNDTFLTTINILKLMKRMGWSEIYFSSTSAIYGDHGEEVLVEEIGNCHPISNYGAMKLASEAAISAACEDFLHVARVYRFPNVIGTPATHGVIYDFINKVLANSHELTVLGDGSQRKSYLHVSELIDAMFFINNNSTTSNKIDIYNIGPTDNGIYVRDIADIVVCLFQERPKLIFGSGDRGWVGDVPRFSYSVAKLQKLGWVPKMHSKDAITLAASEIFDQLSSQIAREL